MARAHEAPAFAVRLRAVGLRDQFSLAQAMAVAARDPGGGDRAFIPMLAPTGLGALR